MKNTSGIRKLLTLLLVAATVTSFISPAVFATGAKYSGKNDLNQVDIDEDKTSLGLRIDALAKLNTSGKTQLFDKLNSTTKYYITPNRVNSGKVFRTDKNVLESVSNQKISAYIAHSDRKLANVSIQKTQKVVEKLEQRKLISDAKKTSQRIDSALRNLRKGNKYLDKGKYKKSVSSYRKSWNITNDLLTRLDREVTPQVKITTESDPVRNGSGNVTVAGNVFDVMPENFNGATVYVNGKEKLSKTLNRKTLAQNTTFSFKVELEKQAAKIQVEVTESVENNSQVYLSIVEAIAGPDLKVSFDELRAAIWYWANDEPVPRTNGKKVSYMDLRKLFRMWKKTSDTSSTDINTLGDLVGIKKPGKKPSIDDIGINFEGFSPAKALKLNESSAETILQNGSDTLLVDGDGLPTNYEKKHTKTDPLDHNSNSEKTKSDESKNSTIDSREDLEGDSLTNYREYKLGTEPLNPDTDDDEVTDSYELGILDTDPLKQDSDNNGTKDGEEDPDGDSLTNSKEEKVGTYPKLADSDGEGLNDSKELEIGTDPWKADTDTDYLDDAAELQDPFNTDPLDNNTNDDPAGVVDGKEEYTTQKENESLGVVVKTKGKGDAASDITIENGSRKIYQKTAIDNVSVSSMVTVSYEPDRLPEKCYESCDGPIEGAPAENTKTKGTYVSVENRTANRSVSRTSARKSTSSPGRGLSKAVITVYYDESKVPNGDEENLSLYGYKGGIHSFVKLNSSVNTKENTVSAPVKEFSDFAVFHKGDWVDVFESSDSVGDFPGKTIRRENFDNSDGWNCRNWAREGPYNDTVKRGFCKVKDGYAMVQEESNRRRFYEKEVKLPDNENLAVSIRLKAHTHTSWSRAQFKVMDGGDTKMIYELHTRYTSDPVTKGWLTTTVDISEFAGREINLSLQANGRHTLNSENTTSWIKADYIEIVESKDSDDDGIPNSVEKGGVLTGMGEVKTDPNDADTDGDGLKDGKEVITSETVSLPKSGKTFYKWRSNPTLEDSDGDGLNDSTEFNGWDVDLGGSTYSTSNENLGDSKLSKDTGPDIKHVTSNALIVDTDNDGVSDEFEKNKLQTDPREKISKDVTLYHQAKIVDRLKKVKKSRAVLIAKGIGLIGHNENWRDLKNLELDDGSDSFDFIYFNPDERRNIQIKGGDSQNLEKLFAYKALDHELRTDTWMSNTLEETMGTDPYDVDTDNDGLTDGQETLWITKWKYTPGELGETYYSYVWRDPDVTYKTDPTKKDTDGDKFWDGWLGVHKPGIERQDDDVVLYMENAATVDDRDSGQKEGISGNEMVSAQVGYHDLNPDIPSRIGTDIDGDGNLEHSNIHIGELRLGSDPTDGNWRNKNAVPDNTLQVEVDYYEGAADVPLEVLSDVEKNYALYGLKVEFTKDDEFDDAELTLCDDSFDCDPPTSRVEANRMENTFHDDKSKAYMFITTTGEGFVFNQLSDGAASDDGRKGEIAGLDFGITIFTEDHYGDDEPNNDQLYFQKTIVHEVGHLIGAGRADDKREWWSLWHLPKEIYSGDDDPNDPTKERVNLEGDPDVAEWSVMAPGWQSEILLPPMNENYIAFSLEELSTIEFHNIDTVNEE